MELLEYFAIAVTIVVVAVHEELPLTLTLGLAFAMKKKRTIERLFATLQLVKLWARPQPFAVTKQEL